MQTTLAEHIKAVITDIEHMLERAPEPAVYHLYKSRGKLRDALKSVESHPERDWILQVYLNGAARALKSAQKALG